MYKRIRVFGKVQGVYFRESTKAKALELGINGYVKNESDGSVLIIAGGDEDQLIKLEKWSKNGPPSAQVERLAIEQINENLGFATFDVKYESNLL